MVLILPACHQRGMPFIQIPDNPSQVDSWFGGKTAINHPPQEHDWCVYQPKLVLADIGTLDTLPDRG